MKEKIYTVAIPLFSLLCQCNAKERIELPKQEEEEALGECILCSSLFPDELIAQIEMEFFDDTEKNAASCRKKRGIRCDHSKEIEKSMKTNNQREE